MFFMSIFLIILIVPFIGNLYFYRNSTSAYKAIFKTIVMTMVILVGYIGLISYIYEPLGEQFMKIAEEIASTIAKDGNASTALGMQEIAYEEKRDLIILLYATINKVMPAVYLILVTVISYFAYAIIYGFQRNSKNLKMPRLEDFKYFAWPQNCMMGIFIIAMLSLILGKMDMFSDLALFENMNILFEAAFIAQGIAVYLFYASMKKFPKIGKWIVFIIMLSTGIGRIAFLLAGIIDYVFGIRGKLVIKSRR